MIAMVPLNTVIGMPEASTDDNGKIMRIENGEWTVSEETEKPIPSNVDLSVFESEGIITENYPDGSSVTYTFEFDSEGNPVKITDSSGNETVLGW
ncbi:MAG: RHS repeat protein, partial [Oscillospiraceae bacterium]|nr:RHS repeat protein [Oscillospiraceae bacterium]